MFVRLFVDENLDRHVPISKQPKEKIQAIIDSCTRQFPEFSVRSRKRIRTYLKSCRRTKRSREQAGLDINNVSLNLNILYICIITHVTPLLTAAHPASPDQRAGGAAAGPRLRERGGERQEDADGDRARVAVAALTNCHITGKQ